MAEFNVTGMAWKEKDKETGLFVENIDESLIKSDSIDMTRIISKDHSTDIHGATFVSIGVGTAWLPSHFGDECFLRVIPFLQKIDVKSIDTIATTEAYDPTKERGRLIGAAVWPKYGYANQNMKDTLQEFLKYLQEDRKINLTIEEADDIQSLERMHKLAELSIKRNEKDLSIGIDFLLGDNGTGKYSRDVIWHGVIPDINNMSSNEMVELRNRLANPKQKMI